MAIFNSYVSLPEGSSWISLGMFFGSVVTWVTERPIFVEARNMKHGNGKSIVHRWFSLWNIGASPKHEDTGRVHHYPMTDHIGSMYAIYGNVYHQYTPNVSIYTSTMDPIWLDYVNHSTSFKCGHRGCQDLPNFAQHQVPIFTLLGNQGSRRLRWRHGHVHGVLYKAIA